MPIFMSDTAQKLQPISKMLKIHIYISRMRCTHVPLHVCIKMCEHYSTNYLVLDILYVTFGMKMLLHVVIKTPYLYTLGVPWQKAHHDVTISCSSCPADVVVYVASGSGNGRVTNSPDILCVNILIYYLFKYCSKYKKKCSDALNTRIKLFMFKSNE